MSEDPIHDEQLGIMEIRARSCSLSGKGKRNGCGAWSSSVSRSRCGVSTPTSLRPTASTVALYARLLHWTRSSGFAGGCRLGAWNKRRSGSRSRSWGLEPILVCHSGGHWAQRFQL
jgi:hypothetical protein